MTHDDTQAVTWFHPGNYPSRCSEACATRIAEAVRQGVEPKIAAAAEGVAPSRFMKWLRWGKEAYDRDADDADAHAQYLNLFLKVNQAIALAADPIQRMLYHDHEKYWLEHHSETRNVWGMGAPLAQPILTPAEEENVVEALPAPTHVFKQDPETVRTVLQMLIESGAAIPEVNAADEAASGNANVVDERAERTGTDE